MAMVYVVTDLELGIGEDTASVNVRRFFKSPGRAIAEAECMVRHAEVDAGVAMERHDVNQFGIGTVWLIKGPGPTPNREIRIDSGELED